MRPHGTYTIELLGRIILVDAVGPFNDDAVKKYARDLSTFAEKLAPTPWALCAVFRNECLFTPDAEAELTAVTQWRKEMGMSVVAVVFKEVKERTILQAQMERVYKTTDLQYDFFNEKCDALSWLAQKGYAPVRTTHCKK